MPNTSQIFNEIETRCIANENNKNKDNDEDDDSRAMACALMPSLLLPPLPSCNLLPLLLNRPTCNRPSHRSSVWHERRLRSRRRRRRRRLHLKLIARWAVSRQSRRQVARLIRIALGYLHSISDIFLVFFLYCTFIIRWWQIRFDIMLGAGQQVDLISHRYLQQDNRKQMQSPYDKSWLTI